MRRLLPRPLLALALACSDPAPDATPDAGTPDVVTTDVVTDVVADVDPGPKVRDRCVVTVAAPPPAPLRTFYVDGTAGDDSKDGLTKGTAWKTLTKANGTAQPGDLFLVKGTFVGQYIRPSKSGTTTDMIVYRVAAGDKASVQKAQYGTAAWLGGIENVVVDGFELTGNQDPASLGNGDWLRNCDIHDNTGYIRIIDTNDSRVEDNVIDRCGDYCFWMSGSSTKNSILRNRIGRSKSVSFYAWSAGNTIGGNDFANPLESELLLTSGAASTTVECNRFHLSGTQSEPGYYTPALMVSSNANVIRYNLVYGNKLEGMGFWVEANDNDVYHNVVWGNGGPAIRMLVDQVGKEIRSNKFRNNVFWNGNSVDDTHWNYQGTKGKVVVDTYHVQTNAWTDGTFGGNTLSHNLIGMNDAEIGKGWLFLIGYTKNQTLTLAEAQTKWPTSLVANFEADPAFFDAPSADFRPKANSPCIDKGEPIQALTFTGAAPDLGRYEAVAE